MDSVCTNTYSYAVDTPLTSIFGILTFALEFAIPEVVVYNMGFMFSLLGRAVCKLCVT